MHIKPYHSIMYYINLNKISYFFSWCKYKLQTFLSTKRLDQPTVHQETSKYEQSVLKRFLSTAFIPVDKMEVLDPPIKMLQNIFYDNSTVVNPWIAFSLSWFIHDTTKKIYGKRSEKSGEKTGAKKQIRNLQCNSQVDSIFFRRKELKNHLENPKNELESTWRSRILIENTPRGNVIMFYNAYKEAFAYYSDQTAMPYRILNAVAMKYVMKFHCADFFIDETVLGANNTNPSPFINIIKDEIRAENDKKKQVVSNLLGTSSSSSSPSPFVKVKSNIIAAKDLVSQAPSNVKKPISQAKSTTPEEDLMKNRFVYMGKIANFSILKKPPKRRQMPLEWADFVSEYDEMFDLQSEAQQNCIDYKMFKKLKEKTPNL